MGFTKIKMQAPPVGKTVELVLNQLDGDPVLTVEHLGETNITYWNDAVARAQAQGVTASAGRGKKVTPADIAAARERNRTTVATHSVRDIAKFFHDSGEAATKDDIAAIIAALPDDVFDSVLKFVSDPNNFRDDAPILGNAKEIAGK
jgi:hypothetical protein